MRAIGALAGLAALAVLTVVAASVTIRLGVRELGEAIAIVRGVHRAAASLAALLVFVLAALALRRRELRAATSAALALTIVLSIVGWVTGTDPPRPAAWFNQLGGIALAALLAWLHGRTATLRIDAARERPLAAAAVLFACVQAAYGGTLATFFPDPPVPLLLAHAALGLAAAATVAALGLRFAAAGFPAHGIALAACAALAPAAGTLSVLTAAVLPIQVGHAFAAALLLAAATHAHARLAASA